VVVISRTRNGHIFVFLLFKQRRYCCWWNKNHILDNQVVVIQFVC